jgi:hypothetical protein
MQPETPMAAASDLKSASGCTIELVAGCGEGGHADGPLHLSRFTHPTHLCRWGDQLIVSDFATHSIRLIDGVSSITPFTTSQAKAENVDSGGVSSYAARISTRIVAAVPVLLKELAAIIAEYARPIGVRTIAGDPNQKGARDGHALRHAQFNSPSGVAIDESDPVAGPQLIIGDYDNHCIRCLNLRTEEVTTIAGHERITGHVDGPAHKAKFGAPLGLVVAPNGVIFVTEQVRGAAPHVGIHCRLTDDAAALLGLSALCTVHVCRVMAQSVAFPTVASPAADM